MYTTSSCTLPPINKILHERQVDKKENHPSKKQKLYHSNDADIESPLIPPILPRLEEIYYRQHDESFTLRLDLLEIQLHQLKSSIKQLQTQNEELFLKIDKLVRERGGITPVNQRTSVRGIPINFLVLSHHAYHLYLQGMLEQARKLFEQALSFPNADKDFFTISHYAHTLYRLEKLEEAEKIFRKAWNLPKGKENPFILSGWAETLRLQNKLEEAEKLFKMALALPGTKEDLFILSRYAATLFQQGNLEESTSYLEKIMNLPGGHKDPFVFQLLCGNLSS